jgi:hypothetical protein
LIPHNLSATEVLQRVKNVLKKERGKHQTKMQNLIERWNGNAGTFSARIKGFHVSGTLKVTGSHIIIDGKYPLIGIIYKDRIESAIRQAAVKVLA